MHSTPMDRPEEGRVTTTEGAERRVAVPPPRGRAYRADAAGRQPALAVAFSAEPACSASAAARRLASAAAVTGAAAS